MERDRVAESLAGVISLYVVMNYFVSLYDKLYVEIKLIKALSDPENYKELRKCFEMPAKELEKWHCILNTIGAEDIWEKYKDVWAKMG